LPVLQREGKQLRSWRTTAKQPQRPRTQGLTLPQPEEGLEHAASQSCIRVWHGKKPDESFPSRYLTIAKNGVGFYRQLFRGAVSRISLPERYFPTAISTPNSVSFQRLFELLDERGEDDHGKMDPSQHAFKNACILALTAEEMLGRDIKCAPVVDSEGGIRITWRSRDKQVKLVCPATPKSPIYIYESSPKGNTIYNKDVTSLALARRLSWLLDGDQPK
jgi:hypothetical protein